MRPRCGDTPALAACCWSSRLQLSCSSASEQIAAAHLDCKTLASGHLGEGHEHALEPCCDEAHRFVGRHCAQGATACVCFASGLVCPRHGASASEYLSIVVMCLGTVATGVGDLDFDVVGYGIALAAAAACQSLYLVLARHAQDKVPGMRRVDLLYFTALYNCVICVPLAFSEITDVLDFRGGDRQIVELIRFLVPFVSLRALLNFSTFWCTAATSRLTTAVAGNARGILSTLLGFLLFRSRLTPIDWVGLLCTTTRVVVYSAAQ